jgi:O-antigen ligase
MRSDAIGFRKSPKISAAQIQTVFGNNKARFIPIVIWIALIAWVTRNTIFVRQRSGSDFAQIDILAGVQISLVLLVVFAGLLSKRALPVWFKTSGTSLRMLFIYYFICAISAIWSPLPTFTMYRSIEFMAMLMGAVIALTYATDFIKAERTFLLVSVIVIVLGMLLIVKFYGLSTSLRHWHTNTYTASAAMVLCYCFGEYFNCEKSRKRLLKWVGFFALAVVVLGTSSSSFIAVIMGVLFTAMLYRKVALFVIGSLFMLVILLVNMLVTIDLSVLFPVLFPGKSETEIYTLTGRVQMWESFFDLILESPTIGHGFAVLSTGRGGVFSADPHNSIFSVLLGTGLIGLIVVLIYFFRLLREFFRTSFLRLPGAIGCGAGLATGLVNTLTMTLVLDEWEESSLIFACLSALLVFFVLLPYRRKNRTSPVVQKG